jgi:capsular exopolysaccharide synthesis family protein
MAAGHEEEEAAGRPLGGVSLYLHAFRRHWPLAITLGLACAALAVTAAWFVARDKYTAVSLLRISANEQQLVFQRPDGQSDSNFEVYKGTQQQLITSEVVLIAALRKKEVAGLGIVQKEDDPVRWLSKTLHAEFPGNAEIMRVSLTGERPDEMATLVNAVVETYMSEAVEVERILRKQRLVELDRLYHEKETEIRSKRTDLKQLAELVGTGDTGALALKQQIALQQYAEARNELGRLRTELQRAKDDLQIKLAWVNRIKELRAASKPSALESFDKRDPEIKILREKIGEIDNYASDVRQRVKDPAILENLTGKYLREKARLEKKIAERRKELTEEAGPKRNGRSEDELLEPEIAELKARIEILTAQEKMAAADLDKQRLNAEKFGNSSVDIEMLRSDLAYLDKVFASIANEREKLKVELDSMLRISIFQPAVSPHSPDASARLGSVTVGGLGSFLGVIFLVLWWDVRKQRINSPHDLDRGMGLTVVGTVPLLPQKVLRPGRQGKHGRRWRASLDRAVDSVAARLFLRKDSTKVQVVFVSSAAQGEGKTSLAVHLAKRLASTGQRTLLVDFDLRRPSVHRMFGLPREPGVGECLEQGAEPGQVVHATDTENLSIISAGCPLYDSLGRLSNGATTAFFEKVRAGFTFVIVDGSPILPVIDGLLVSQHADTVVLSVRRDKSQAPQVLRACEKLAAFGSGKYVAVLNGCNEEGYGSYQEPLIQARVTNDVTGPVASEGR